MNSKVYKINNLEELEKLAQELLKKLHLPAIVLLSGDLGAGKTAFVKAMGKALKIKETITSPTFNLMNTYSCRFKKDKIAFIHLDLYRLANDSDISDLNLLDASKNLKFLAFIEWSEKVRYDWFIYNANLYQFFFKIDFNKKKYGNNISEMPRTIKISKRSK
ncbi:MAG: tRNA (adenosine(37)-N6)-threonylcarbamoyltransferase complex ATPase subunit type 1 TsaE [Spirochaetia bacterium]|nr:tRNA (adenosine(37)-N6)-threonylcarbamoyltransferase complex ATPase subunit type 1 TsaE [Spirochaetia bacterium]